MSAVPALVRNMPRILPKKKKSGKKDDDMTLPVFQLEFELHHPNAMLPSRAYPHDAGLDLFVPEDIVLQPHETKSISTGVSIRGGLPPGVYGLICGRSGWGKKGLLVNPGTVDPYYTGELYVTLHNLNPYQLEIKALDRIAQIVIKPFLYFDPVAYMPDGIRADAGAARRGNKGMGSTGD